ncbi:MAG: hypothetical protein ACFB10_08665 [Salibacteraceae bacterium]
MDIEDLMYYAIIIGSILVSLLGKKKKKKTTSTGPIRDEVDEPATRDVETILGDILRPREQPSPAPVSQPAEPESIHTSKDDYYISADSHHQKAEARKKEMQDNKRKASRTSSSSPFDIETEEEAADFQFNLRQAVLYSEILKRPEY